MTKLMEWLTGFLAIFTVWLSILIGSNLAISHPNLTLFWPILFIVIPFGLFSVAVIIYRVYNFNDCAEAAKELQSEIKTAREDLKKKGMVFYHDLLLFGWSMMEFSWNPQNIFDGKTKYALLILNTQILNEKHLLNLWNNANYKITVDGGTNRWYKIANNFEKNYNIPETTQIIPDLISGDLDSIDSDVLNFFKDKCEVINTPDQNYTDFTKTIQLISANNTVEVDYIVAFSEHSGRLDQILGNLQTLYEVEGIGTPVLIISSHSLEWLLQPGQHTIQIPHKHRDQLHCGLIPLGEPCSNIKTEGLKWNLNPQDILAFGTLVSTSNKFDPNADHVLIRTDKRILFTMEVIPTEQ